jgi:hypothetical protein
MRDILNVQRGIGFHLLEKRGLKVGYRSHGIHVHFDRAGASRLLSL